MLLCISSFLVKGRSLWDLGTQCQIVKNSCFCHVSTRGRHAGKASEISGRLYQDMDKNWRTYMANISLNGESPQKFQTSLMSFVKELYDHKAICFLFPVENTGLSPPAEAFYRWGRILDDFKNDKGGRTAVTQMDTSSQGYFANVQLCMHFERAI